MYLSSRPVFKKTGLFILQINTEKQWKQLVTKQFRQVKKL